MHIHNVHAVDIESEVWSAAGCESHNEFIKENITELNNCVSDMIGKEHTKDCLSPVHTSNNVETTFDFVKATFDFPKNGNNVERVYRKISFFRQSRNKLDMFSLIRLCRKNRSTCVAFDRVASTLLLVWTGL